MTTLTPRPVSTRQLHWDPAARQYIGEISDTHGFGRVYDDACDEGLTLVSAFTGEEQVFVVDRTEVRDGEIVAWTLVPADVRSLRSGPVTVLLFND